jgi:hypothetical protein
MYAPAAVQGRIGSKIVAESSTVHQFIRIVVMKGQGVIAGWAFVAHLLKLIKI